MIRKTASAHWTGTIKDGQGHISTQSGALSDQPYGFNTRFEDAPGTNPEELIGAAHAGCFTMALSKILQEQAGVVADELSTEATVKMEKDGDGFTITGVDLHLKAKIPGVDEEAFFEAAKTAKENCPVSRLLAAADITLDAELV
ncbi:Peroxiredoxin OsmC [Pseudooceanicola marinus]|uniref:Peroxiredoxin OsmC n=1 Tax=Pseudooceanicola marinus TaxID=396013 RepID=A0A1X6Z9K1_9RHOB|nr:OsmC family protein [Pseudooceanicola marinus]MCA1334164.1 OsmC family protein [Pseudooceanicola marinus]SLN45260.1 Peroxiredoxin OsmC [Pseudooceanicola marinus]